MDIAVIYLLGVLELWLAVPVGLAMDAGSVPTGVISVLGALSGTWLVLPFGEKLRKLVEEKTGFDMFAGNKGALYKIWLRYGVIGLGLLSPLISGAPIGVILGSAFGAEKKRMAFWVSAGVVIWGVIITAAFSYGWSIFGAD